MSGSGGGGGPAGGQAETAFAAILRRVVEATPGAVAAVFADEEGEAVDLHGEGDPLDLMLAAAHMGVLLRRLEEARKDCGVGDIGELRVSAKAAQYVTRPLGHGYQVTVILEPVATMPKLERALDEAVVHLRLEAGGVID